MSDVNETWSSPWRTLQKNLASGFAFEAMESGRNLWICEPQGVGRVVPATSWLVRARSRKTSIPRIIQ
jgi:hypothetical protein